MARRYYSSIAQATTLNGSINSTTTTVVVTATTGFPSSFPYTLIIDPDTVNEEVVTVTGAASTTLTVTRGVDGTTGVAHSSGAVVRHGVSARDFDEPNAFINGTGVVTSGMIADGAIVDADINASAAIAQSKIANLTSDLAAKIGNAIVDAKGDLIAATAADTVSRLAVGTNGQVLVADSSTATGLAWGSPAGGLDLVASTGFSSVNEVLANNIFTTNYFSYRVVLYALGSTTADVALQFRASGSTLSGSNYLYASSALTSANGAADFGAAGQTSLPLQGVVSGLYLYSSMDILGPRSASGFQVNWQGAAYNGAAYLMRNAIGLYYAGDVADGIRISCSGGTMSGHLRVYGYKNN